MTIPYEIGQTIYTIDGGQIVKATVKQIIIFEGLMELDVGLPFTIYRRDAFLSKKKLIKEMYRREKIRHEARLKELKEMDDSDE